MNKKLILTGIALLTILSACSERDEEIHPQKITETDKIEKDQATVSGKIVIDSLKTHDATNGTNSYQSENETIDPTKPDKPW